MLASDHNGGGKPLVRLLGIACRQIDTELFLDPLGALSGREVRTHQRSLTKTCSRVTVQQELSACDGGFNRSVQHNR
jgi:hypothetical protein